MAVKAKELMQQKELNDVTNQFYQGKIHTMEFFFKYELPHADACAQILMNEKNLTNLREMDCF
jgi:butyryl-CoA dehydrogenase